MAGDHLTSGDGHRVCVWFRGRVVRTSTQLGARGDGGAIGRKPESISGWRN